MSYRDTGYNTLSKYLKNEKNVKKIETQIFKLSSDENEYNDIIYEIIGEIINKNKLNDIMFNLKNNKYLWNNILYKDIYHKILEQNDFIENPFEVEEGVIECNCGSKRVFSYSKQTRGADEPMTTFAQCMSCKKSWSYSG